MTCAVAVLTAPAEQSAEPVSGHGVVVQLVLFGPPIQPASRVRRRRAAPAVPAASSRALARRRAAEFANREALRAMLASYGFEHAIPTVASAFAAELLGGFDDVVKDQDDRLEDLAGRFENLLLNAAAAGMMQLGWRR